jgi:hypothetical protein
MHVFAHDQCLCMKPTYTHPPTCIFSRMHTCMCHHRIKYIPCI